ncbi:MAG: hypothetical protein H0U71_04910 [Gammaproteobacteria bacterium]|nr:hypothetical protein [Gammaproteobacteria bacterium]
MIDKYFGFLSMDVALIVMDNLTIRELAPLSEVSKLHYELTNDEVYWRARINKIFPGNLFQSVDVSAPALSFKKIYSICHNINLKQSQIVLTVQLASSKSQEMINDMFKLYQQLFSFGHELAVISLMQFTLKLHKNYGYDVSAAVRTQINTVVNGLKNNNNYTNEAIAIIETLEEELADITYGRSPTPSTASPANSDDEGDEDVFLQEEDISTDVSSENSCCLI